MKMSCQLQKNRLGPKNSIFTLILWRVKKTYEWQKKFSE
jgi:hypothetical protein